MLTPDYRPKSHHFHLQPHLLNDNSFIYARFHNLEKHCSIKAFRRFSCTCTLWYKILLTVALIFLTVSHSNLIFSHNPLSSRPISPSDEVIIAQNYTCLASDTVTVIAMFMHDFTIQGFSLIFCAFCYKARLYNYYFLSLIAVVCPSLTPSVDSGINRIYPTPTQTHPPRH